jgi:hippurate hydrolase
MVLGNIRRIVAHQSQSFGCTSEIREGVPGAVLVNDGRETEKAVAIARKAFGDDRVLCPGPGFLASEDFAFMLQEKRGTYCFIGGGPGKMVHHPEYRFNQEILPIGAAYWVALVENYLPYQQKLKAVESIEA